MRRVRSILAPAMAALLAVAGASARTEPVVPGVRGYAITSVQSLASGVVYAQYRSGRPARVVNVAFIRRDQATRFMPVLSNGRFAGGQSTETTSAMCRRWRCLLAVNGDFFSVRSGVPVGGMAVDGRTVRSPAPRVNFVLGSDKAFDIAGVLHAGVSLQFRSLLHPRRMESTAFNSARPRDGFAVYTPEWGQTTEQPGDGYEIVFRVLNPPLLADKPVELQLLRAGRQGNSWIPSDGIVVSGHGAAAEDLAEAWAHAVRDPLGSLRADLHVTFGSGVRRFIGGNLAVLTDGRDLARGRRGGVYASRHPRTLVGRTWDGDLVLAVVDGRQSGWSIGMTLHEAAQFLRSAGVADAINLDGGGSATFVKHGIVVNRPSDGRERPVASAIAIVP